jgi:hypothetical protein
MTGVDLCEELLHLAKLERIQVWAKHPLHSRRVRSSDLGEKFKFISLPTQSAIQESSKTCLKEKQLDEFIKLTRQAVPTGFEPAIRIFVQAQFGDRSI